MNNVTELHPSWDHARNYLAGVSQALRLSIAGQVLVGMELMQLKKDLGFIHGANKGGPRGQFVHTERTWSEWVSAELGISYKTADRMILMFDAARARLKKIGHTGDLPGGTKKLALIVDARPTTLADEDREKLAAVVERLTDGATQADLLEELRLVKKHTAPPIQRNTSRGKDESTAGQLAFHFFEPVAASLITARTSPDYQKLLHSLPLESDADHPLSLATLEAEFRSALADIEAVKQSALKSTRGRIINA
jgi:hypothetical protein